MFLDNLSTTVLRLCDENDLTYESASERCNLSPRYFGDIARGKTAPTIHTLEKLCVSFDRTPNELLIPVPVLQEISFRKQLPVTHIRCYRNIYGLTGFPVCPRCRLTLEREYQAYCDRCGQCLGWKTFSRATVILPERQPHFAAHGQPHCLLAAFVLHFSYDQFSFIFLLTFYLQTFK